MLIMEVIEMKRQNKKKNKNKKKINSIKEESNKKENKTIKEESNKEVLKRILKMFLITRIVLVIFLIISEIFLSNFDISIYKHVFDLYGRACIC